MSKPIPEDEEIRRGSRDSGYSEVYCPVRKEWRSSLLCATVCADTSWGDKRAKECREQCDIWDKVKEKHKEMRDESESEDSEYGPDHKILGCDCDRCQEDPPYYAIGR